MGPVRAIIFTVLFTFLTGMASYAGANGWGSDSTLHKQQSLRSVHGRTFIGGGLRGGK